MKNSAVYQNLIHKADTLLSMNDSNNTKPIIAVWGLMNAGKSYLLNMLTDHVSEDYFKTNDIRETAEIKIYEDDEFIFIDTPGLDANEGDDLEAHKGVKEADIVLFVHQPQGALEKNEIEFLSMLKKRYGENADTSIILVLSKIDREPREKIELIQSEVLRQCEEIIDISPQCFTVSGIRYKKGIVDHNTNFVTASHVGELKHYLLDNTYDVESIRKNKKIAETTQMIEEITFALSTLVTDAHNLNRDICERFKSFDEDMAQFSSWLRGKSQEAQLLRIEISWL